MKQALKGFQCTDETRLIIGDPYEMVLFIQTVCMAAGIDPYVENLTELVETLDEQVKARFSPELQVCAIDGDTLTPATKRSEEVFLAISPIENITVH